MTYRRHLVRPAPLVRGDDFPRGLFGARYAGRNSPARLADATWEERRRARAERNTPDDDDRLRLRLATADANRHRRREPA